MGHDAVHEPLVQVALRGGFEALGWRTSRLLWMNHETAPPRGPDIAVETVAYEDVQALRVDWLRADGFPDYDPGDFHAQARRAGDRADDLLSVCLLRRSSCSHAGPGRRA